MGRGISSKSLSILSCKNKMVNCWRLFDKERNDLCCIFDDVKVAYIMVKRSFYQVNYDGSTQ